MNQYRFDDIVLGMAHSFDVVITEEMVENFINITNDTNPLHSNDSYAKDKGFAGRVAFGMLVASFYSTLAGVYIPGKFSLLHGIDVSFNSPVYISDKLTIFGEVAYMNELYHQIEIKAYITRNKKKISKAKIKVGFHE
jgi:3-hydroxybutyryl-CoA dehydratase|tara:strand:+ start:148 stop:561 length:414 start_codon:yes stop_codon:yes gene_type:complete